MEINKLKILSMAVCCFVSLCSDGQCTEIEEVIDRPAKIALQKITEKMPNNREGGFYRRRLIIKVANDFNDYSAQLRRDSSLKRGYVYNIARNLQRIGFEKGDIMLVLQNVDKNDVEMLMPVLRPLILRNPAFVECVPKESDRDTITSILHGLEDEYFKSQALAYIEAEESGAIEQPRMHRGTVGRATRR